MYGPESTPLSSVLYLSPSDLPDMEVESALSFLDQLPPGLSPTLVVDGPGALADAACAREMPVACVEVPSRVKPRDFRRASHRLSELCPAPALAHVLSPTAVCLARAALPPGTPVVWQLRGSSAGGLTQVLARRCATRAMGTDPALIRQAGLSLKNRKVSLLPLAASEKTFVPPTSLAPPAVGQPMTFGMICGGTREGGASEFLLASRLFQRARLPGTFLLRSDSSLESSLALGAGTREPVTEGIVREPQRPVDRRAFLDSLDVLVVPSRRLIREDLLIEAMARGITVVATSVNGVARLLASGDTGWLTVPRDAVGLFRACRFLAQNPTLSRSIGLRAHARARIAFPPVAQRGAILSVYRELLAPTAGALAWPLSAEPGIGAERVRPAPVVVSARAEGE